MLCEHHPKQEVQLLSKRDALRLLLQMVPWAPHWQGGREAPDGEGEARQLFGAGEPEQTGRFRVVSADKRG